MKNSVEILLSDARGVFIPANFLECFDVAKWGLNDENRKHWQGCENVDNEWYWDSWQWILDNAKHTDKDGHLWRLWQDGDLFAYCEEIMAESVKQNFFGDY